MLSFFCLLAHFTWAKRNAEILYKKQCTDIGSLYRYKDREMPTVIRSGQGSSQLRSQRCDPVTLYHQYQQLWKQQKLPGENNHNELRWSIRERMLGQDPQIRVSNVNCDETTIYKIAGNLLLALTVNNIVFFKCFVLKEINCYMTSSVD